MINGHRMGAFNESVDGGSSFGGQSLPVLPVITVDGSTGSPLGVHRNSTAAAGFQHKHPGTPDWRAGVAALRLLLIGDVTNDDQTAVSMLEELDALVVKIDKHFAARNHAKALDLKAELAEISGRGRAAVAKHREAVANASARRGAYNSYLEQVREAQSDYKEQLQQLALDAPTEENFNKDEEIAEHAEQVAVLREKLDSYGQEANRLLAVAKAAEAKAKAAKRDLDAIRARRSELKNLLGGNVLVSPIASLGPVGLRE